MTKGLMKGRSACAYSYINNFTIIFCSFSFNKECYKYLDGSSMFTIKTMDLKRCINSSSSNCVIEKKVSAPIETTNVKCVIEWHRTMFLNYDQWNSLPNRVKYLQNKSFELAKQDSMKATLKVRMLKTKTFCNLKQNGDEGIYKGRKTYCLFRLLSLALKTDKHIL